MLPNMHIYQIMHVRIIDVTQHAYHQIMHVRKEYVRDVYEIC